MKTEKPSKPHKTKAKLLFYLMLLSYLIYMLVSWGRQGLNFISWHTHLMIYVYAYMIFKLLNERILKGLNKSLLSWTKVLLFSLFLAELVLLTTGATRTVSEQISGKYASPYQPFNRSYYHLWNPSIPTHTITKGEYSYTLPTNSLGFPDQEWNLEKIEGEIRIVALGDSFTEGDGAPADSSFPALLRNLFALNDMNHVSVLNAGVCGSDPFYNFVALKDKILDFQPDIVLQTYSSHDLTTDILLRGGFERFSPDGTVRFKKGPWWEPIYAISHVSRVFFSIFGYTELLQKPYPSEKELSDLEKTLQSLNAAYIRFAKGNNIKLIIVFRPDKEEIQEKRFRFEFSQSAEQFAAADIEVIDLLPCYIYELANRPATLTELFWEIDGHHNAKGYEMMATCIYRFLDHKQLLHQNPDSAGLAETTPPF